MFHIATTLILADVSNSSGGSDAPFYFLAFGFSLILLIFLLMNLDRRFREYLSRSLIRPFNFFADIRDQRIIPNVQTTLLAISEAGAVALWITSLAFTFKDEVPGVLQRLSLPATMGSLATEPGQSLVILTIVLFVKILVITLLMRLAAIFVRGRIYVSDAFNVVTWALLPLVVLLPFDLILPRLDPTRETLTFVAVILGALSLWSYQRLMKGTGVLFDVYPTVIYVYGTVLLALVALVAFFVIG